MQIKKVPVPHLGITAHFVDRKAMKAGHPTMKFKARPAAAAPKTAQPIDWTKGDSLTFALLGNGAYGDCMEVLACHGDNTFTGNVGTESVFVESAVVADYLALAGGDNGLDEGTLLKGWGRGIGGIQQANILDALDIDPNNGALMQSAMQLYGGIGFTLAVPDPWYANFNTNYVWDAGPGIAANPANGHGVWLNGYDPVRGFKDQTWGTHGWITQGGIAVCDP